MKIQIKKLTPYKSQYKITRDDASVELIELDTKTFFTHDICHYVVEKNLKFRKGFWGMLAGGYRFDELFGKENKLTEELRFIEQIVGPVQSVYMGHFKKEQLPMLLSHLDIDMRDEMITACLSEIKLIEEDWARVEDGEILELEFWLGKQDA